jgi:putative nucleotidyltransferase with HDIG domain
MVGRFELVEMNAQAIAAAGTVTEVFRALFLFAVECTPADGIFVALYAPATGLRRCVYSANFVQDDGVEPHIEEDDDLSIFPELPLNTGPQSRAIATGTLINTPDLAAATKGLAMVGTGTDFDEKPPRSSLAVPLETGDRILGAFEVQSVELAAFTDAHIPALEMAARLTAITLHNLELRERERAEHEATLRALGLALEYRDYETKGHTDRVVALSTVFGRVVGLSQNQADALRWGSYLHDLGKVAIPDRILLKPGKLSDEEFKAIERHTLIGVEMCRDIPFVPAETREIVKSHHERWDGSGYPDGLEGGQIPYLARLFSLVDVYDALVSERPYKGAWTHDDALAEIRAQTSRQFDPALMEPFMAAVQTHGSRTVH